MERERVADVSEKQVTWIHRYGDQLASYRYRAAMPAAEVGKINGFSCGVNREGDADIVVFTKASMDDVQAAKQLKSEGAVIVADFQDDNFSGQMRPIYEEMSKIADHIVCPSVFMREKIQHEVGRWATVITDPYEFDEVEPHACGDHHLWFGHIRNFPELKLVMGAMGDRKLRVVTGPPQLATVREIPGVIMWSKENLRKAFKLSNIVILPTQPGAEHKTPNRLINAIRQGCFAVCMEHPAYREFRDFMWVGNFPTGLRWTEAFREELNDRVKRAQDYIRDRYSPETIGRYWADFLGGL